MRWNSTSPAPAANVPVQSMAYRPRGSGAEMVIVRLASHPLAANANYDDVSLPAYQAMADHLARQGAARVAPGEREGGE